MLPRIKFLQATIVFMIFCLLIVACSTTGDLSNSLPAAQNLDTKEANKALIENYLAALGTPSYRTVAEKMHAENYVQIRQEFENLYDNADGDSVLMQNMKNAVTLFRIESIQLIDCLVKETWLGLP